MEETPQTLRFFTRLFIFGATLLHLSAASAGVRYVDPRYEERVPLWFDVIGKGLTLKPLELEWDLSQSEILAVGDVRIDVGSVRLLRGQPRALFSNPTWMQKSLFSAWDDDSLVVQWPLGFFAKGTIEAISRSGRSIWKWDFDESDLAVWEDYVSTPGARETVAFSDPRGRAAELMAFTGPFRICISDSGDEHSSRLCTNYYQWGGKAQQLERVEIESKRARVIIDQKDSELKGRLKVPPKKIVSFYALSSEGISYEFFSRTKPFELVEAYEKESKGSEPARIAIVSSGRRPSLPTKFVRRYQEGDIANFFGWSSTIGDFREFWEVEVPKDNPVLFVPGEGAGVFRQEFEITKLPREKDRIFLDEDTPFSTYVDGTRVYGEMPRKMKVKSKENEADADDKEFTWSMRAENRGEINRARLEFDSPEGKIGGHFDMYKGYPGELSARMGFQYGTTGDLILLGEGSASYWFENLLGWNNYWIGRHRWGVTARTSRTIGPFKIKEEVNGLASERSGILQSTSFDLKYRLSPGLWGRDESWGVSVGVDKLDYDVFSTDRSGFGIFWARSMPKIFDSIFNLLPIFRYPKFVDAEFRLYPMIKTPDVSVSEGGGLNYDMVFHGKVLWSKRFFGEAGFGLRSLALRRVFPGDASTSGKNLKYTALHGTAGLGFNF